MLSTRSLATTKTTTKTGDGSINKEDVGSKKQLSKLSAFTTVHNRYKRRPNDPDFVDDIHELIDFSAFKRDERIVSIQVPLSTSSAGKTSNSYYRGPLYGLNEFPGFLFAPNALTIKLQQHLAYASVTKYCELPHTTNIDRIPIKPTELDNRPLGSNDYKTMWHIWTAENYVAGNQYVSKRENNNTIDGKRKKMKKSGNDSNKSSSYYRNFRKLSWATMGYHYDWTARAYHEGAKSPMPDELQKLGSYFAIPSLILEQQHARCNQQQHEEKTTVLASAVCNNNPSYSATACIVNYYNEKSVMGGHRDDLETAIDKPIVSISLGKRPGIFVLGGDTKESEAVVPILVRPGDVMIMGGKSRLNYHSMPRILPQHIELQHDDFETSHDCADWNVCVEDIFDVNSNEIRNDLESHVEFTEFISQHRININLRQVY